MLSSVPFLQIATHPIHMAATDAARRLGAPGKAFEVIRSALTAKDQAAALNHRTDLIEKRINMLFNARGPHPAYCHDLTTLAYNSSQCDGECVLFGNAAPRERMR